MNDSQYNRTEYAFVDEAGGTELPPTDQESLDYYVICGILQGDHRLSEAKSNAFRIVRSHVGSGELKSSNIGSNKSRRKTILMDIAQGNFPFYCLVVDKIRIWKDSGLRWRSSFYKFLHKMFYTRIRRTSFGIKVVADQYGSSEFMESFKRYIEDRNSLFDRFNFASSSDEPLLQIADMIAGTVRRVFLGQESPDLLNILGYPSIPIEEWPPMSSSIREADINGANEFGELVPRLALDSARRFVEEYIGSADQEKHMQAQAIRYLLYRFNQNPEDYVYRAEIIEHLEQETGFTLSEQVLSSTVLAAARDDDVFLSSTDKGVKIPYRTQDIRDWIDRVNSQVVPYLRRIEDARRQILIASKNQYDIIDSDAYPELFRYLSNLSTNLKK